jgi:hypothetical protein
MAMVNGQCSIILAIIRSYQPPVIYPFDPSPNPYPMPVYPGPGEPYFDKEPPGKTIWTSSSSGGGDAK